MSERSPGSGSGPGPELASSPGEEDEFRRLLEEAGPRPPLPQEDLDAIRAAARDAWRAQVPPRRRRSAIASWRRPVFVALAAALAIALGLAWWRVSKDRGAALTVARVEAVTGPARLEVAGRPASEISPGDAIPHGAVIRSDGARLSLRLAGDAALRLDAGTRLRLVSASLFDLESGAVYADTEPGGGLGSPGGDLAVRTPAGTARDVGTRFAVRLEGDRTLRVRVRAGAVVLERRGRFFLTPAGKELLLRRDGSVERRDAAAYGPDWEWVMAASPGFDIEGRTLQELLDWVGRETGWQVRYADPGLAAAARQIVLHGGLGRLRPDQAPFAVLPGAGLAGELQKGTLIVRRAR
jgi:hypothetical protein